MLSRRERKEGEGLAELQLVGSVARDVPKAPVEAADLLEVVAGAL